MRIFITSMIFALLTITSSSCATVGTEAQIRSSNRSTIVNRDISRATPEPKQNARDLSTIDFRNFTFPDFGGANEQSYTLRNGTARNKADFSGYTLRKTYFFDLTGDDEDEAVSHIIVDGCRLGCESSQLFYIHTAAGDQPKLLWKIAVGGNLFGGLKTVNFKTNEIVLEVFGDNSLENGIIRPQADIRKNPRLKNTNYTRFVFTDSESGFTKTVKALLPLNEIIDLTQYRVPITFGEQF